METWVADTDELIRLTHTLGTIIPTLEHEHFLESCGNTEEAKEPRAPGRVAVPKRKRDTWCNGQGLRRPLVLEWVVLHS